MTPPTPSEIHRFRRRYGLWQRELAVHLGVSIRCIQDWESARSTPPAYLRLALEALGERLRKPIIERIAA